MKNLYITLICTVFMLSELKSQNVLTEDFIFAPTDSLENLGNWYRTGINTAYNIKVVAPGLVYTGYAGSGHGNTSYINNLGNGDSVFKYFSTPITSGTAYLSFMMRIDKLPSTVILGNCIGFNPNTGGTNHNTSLYIKRLSDTTFDLGVQKVSGFNTVYTNMVFDLDKTYLVVLKYSIINGIDNDNSSLYVFENAVPAAEPSMAMAETIAGSDFTGQASIFLDNNYAQNGLNGIGIKIDGIRVGTTWATSVLSAGLSTTYENSENNILHQNYPNPFQQETNIKYRIPQKGFVSIKIYDASGVLCTDLLHDTMEAGEHEINWNAAKFPAGMYTCQIQYNGAVVSHKLLRIK